MPLTSFNSKQAFIIRLGTALHQFGTPAYRLEAHLSNVAELLAINGSFMVTPTALTFILANEDNSHPINHMIRVSPGDIDLGSLARTDALVAKLEAGEISLEQARRDLDQIIEHPKSYSLVFTFIAFAVSGGAFAMLMSAGWNDVLWATLLGITNFFLVQVGTKYQRFHNMIEPMVTLTAAVLASAIAQFDPKINISLVVLSSIIIFIPGLSITLALSELANRHLVSGTVRFMDSLMTMFKLYFGTVLGLAISGLIWPEVQYIPAEPVPEWTTWIAVLILSSSLVIMFKSRIKDALFGIGSGIIAYSSTLWANSFLDVSLSAFVGAFAIGIYSNLFARFRKAPALIVSLQGFVLLVPGSKVYIGLNSIISGQNMVDTTSIGPQTFLIFMSLVAGLLFANVAISPNRSL